MNYFAMFCPKIAFHRRFSLIIILPLIICNAITNIGWLSVIGPLIQTFCWIDCKQTLKTFLQKHYRITRIQWIEWTDFDSALNPKSISHSILIEKICSKRVSHFVVNNHDNCWVLIYFHSYISCFDQASSNFKYLTVR